MIDLETLRRYPLFARQSFYMLKEIALISEEIRVKEGDWLFHEQEEATKLYLLREGAISLCMNLYLNGSGQHVEMMSPLGPGEVVGWSSMIKPHIYTLGAIATKPAKLIVIKAVPLRELLEDNPQYGFHLINKLTEIVGERLLQKCVQLLSIVMDSKGEQIKRNV